MTLAVPVPVAARLMADLLFADIARVAIGAHNDEAGRAHIADLAAVITGEA